MACVGAVLPAKTARLATPVNFPSSLEKHHAPKERGVGLEETGVGTSSEYQLERKLKFPRVLRTGDHAEVGRPENSAWKIKVRMIQRVESVEAELQREVLA